MDDNIIKFETITVTPQQAQMWLELNKDNRKLSKHKVEEYLNEIKSGRWRYTHQGIAFDTEGYLLDGQHRLEAIKRAGIATKIVVAYGVSRGEFTIIDRGFPRNMSTITGIDKEYAQCYTFLISIATKNHQRAMPDDVFLLHNVFGDSLRTIHDINYKTRIYTSAPFRSAALISIISGEKNKYVLNTYRELAQGLQTMPKIAFSVFKNPDFKERLAGWVGRVEAYLKARYIFTAAHADLSYVKITEGIQDKYYKEVTDIIASGLGNNPDKEKSALLKMIDERDKQIQLERQRYLRVVSQNIQAEQAKLSMGAKD